MDELQILSATTEIALWELFQSGRTANLTFAIAGVIAVWVAARFSSVAVEKGVNMFGKVILTLFAASVMFGGFSLMMSTEAVWIGHANALASLDMNNGDATFFYSIICDCIVPVVRSSKRSFKNFSNVFNVLRA